ncbi:MAG: UDP-N-acetylmuramate dehydrogenase [Lachnospiraceae bacterium]|nr:UDP-N-acetylmuramate dehydrogenase [Lachnospiraceae bacterium]
MDRAELARIVGDGCVWEREPIRRHTTFRIGGEASYFVAPDTVEDLVELVRYLRQERVPYFLMGNGSNLLVSDQGYEGVMITTHMTGKSYEACQDKTSLDQLVFLSSETERKMAEELLGEGFAGRDGLEGKTLVKAASGILLSTMANAVAEQGLDGFAFASGIPGTLGGAVTMNAGAYGGEIGDCILGAMLLMPDGREAFLDREALELGYRTSIIQREGCLVLWALFAFAPGDSQEILLRMKELNGRRREKQPLEHGSAGSTFKRPEGYYAGRLIEDAGLKGYRIGDVMVSDKHSGFVVNVGNGTYEEAMKVIAHVQETVKRMFGVTLELEVKLVNGQTGQSEECGD